MTTNARCAGREATAWLGALLVSLCCVAPARAQFDAFTWTLAGNASGSGEVTATGFSVVGPDGGCVPPWTAFETTAPVALTIHVDVAFEDHDSWPGPNCFDAPAVIVGGVEHVPPNGACSENGWPDGNYHLDVAVPPSTPFGLGVWSADCQLGPGIAHFSNLTFEVAPEVGFAGAIDPREYWNLDADDLGGAVVGLAGDFDGDGVQDIAVGAPAQVQGPGRVEVRSGFDGSLLFERIGAPSFGRAVAGVGDVTGDGVPDLLVGAPDEGGSTGIPNAGWAFLVSGATGADVFVFEGDSDTRRLGWSVSASGDLDGDGVGELLIGAPGPWSGVETHGAVLVVSGATGALIRQLHTPADTLRFGWSVVAIDLDGDGFDDQVVGAPPVAPTQLVLGRVVAHSGADGHVLWWTEGSGNLGRSLAAAGDLLAGPEPDVLAGAPASMVDGVTVGEVFVLDGATGATMHTLAGQTPGGQFGHSLGVAGDVDGDGTIELAVAVPGELVTRLSSWPSGAIVNDVPTWPGSSGGLIASPGDLDGDGRSDLVTVGGYSVRAWHGLHRPGPPTLAVSGPMLPDTELDLLVGQVPLGIPAALVVGGSPLGMPFHGGVLVPSPDLVLPLVVDGAGAGSFRVRWPSATGAWWVAWLQVWCLDPYGPQGATSSDVIVLSGE